MLTHVNPSVAVCEQKSGQIWPQKGPLGPFSGQIWRATARGAPILRPVGKSLEVLTHSEATLNSFALCGGPLGTCARTLGHMNLCQRRHDVHGGTQLLKGCQCTHKKAVQALQGPYIQSAQQLVHELVPK